MTTLYKHSYPPFLEVTNYNPFNNVKPTQNYIYYKYTNTIVNNSQEFTHKINITNVDPNVDINILFVGGGGIGGNANSRSGGGAGGGGGEIVLSKFKLPTSSSNLPKINNSVFKFQIGNVNTSTNVTINDKLYVATYGKRGGYGSSKKGDGGDAPNGLPLRNIDYNSTTGYGTRGLGSGVGGAGGSYTANGANGSTGSLASGVSGARSYNSIRSPLYVNVDLGDGTGNIKTSYGGSGNQGQQDGANGENGYVLVYYIVNNNITYNNDSLLSNNNKIFYGYNPLGNYISSNILGSIQSWCYIYLNNSGTLSSSDITTINNLIGNNNYNILAVGAGGNGGNYLQISSTEASESASDIYGGGGGAGGACINRININTTQNGLINNIKIGNILPNNGNIISPGEDTIINFTNANNNIIAGGGGPGYSCYTYSLFSNATSITDTNPIFRSPGGYNGSSYITNLHGFYYLKNNSQKFIFNSNNNSNFSPAGGAAIGFSAKGKYGSFGLFRSQDNSDIETIMTNPNKLYPYTMYEMYKGDIPYYLNTYFSQYKNNTANYSNLNTNIINYIGPYGKGYHQDKSPDGLMTRIEVNKNYDSTASPYRNGNIITYNFNNKILSDINTDTSQIVISKGGNSGQNKSKFSRLSNSVSNGQPGSPGFVLIWFKKDFGI